MAIDLGNLPVGTPPTIGEKAQILSAIGGNLTSGPVTSLNGTSSIVDGSIDIAKLGGFGTGVLSALDKNVGVLGAVQLVGDVQTPSAILLPDMTGMTAPVGYIGLKNGQLAVADNVTPGGLLVAQRRYTGIASGDFSGQSKASAFTKLIGVPFSGAEFTAGREFNLTGHLIIKPRNFGFTNITNFIFGSTYNAGSAVAFNQSGPATNWMAWNYTGLTSLLKDIPIRFDILSGTRFMVSYAGGNAGMYDAFKYLRSPTGTVSSLYDATNNELVNQAIAPNGAANTLWFMLQVNSSDIGTYGGDVDVHYDLTLEFTN